DYAVKHLSHEYQIITLCHRSNIRKWHASFKFNTDGTRILLLAYQTFFMIMGCKKVIFIYLKHLRGQTRTTMTVNLLKRYRPSEGITSSESSVYEDTEPWYAEIVKKVEAIQSETPIFVFVKGCSGDYKVYLPHEEQPLMLRRRKKGAAHTK
ncbi:hypothetical protein PVAP13_3NG308950, partial [Panicum virgatum]